MQGLNDAQNRVHMSLWAISGAPLLVGADLTKLSDATLATLTNPAVLAVDQDSLGLQAVKVSEPSKGLEVWSKPLSTPGERAVLLLNRTTAPAPIAVNSSDLGLLSSAPAAVKDLCPARILAHLIFLLGHRACRRRSSPSDPRTRWKTHHIHTGQAGGKRPKGLCCEGSCAHLYPRFLPHASCPDSNRLHQSRPRHAFRRIARKRPDCYPHRISPYRKQHDSRRHLDSIRA